MVTWLKDLTGRFPQRPHYKPSEIDSECENLIHAYMRKKCAKVEYPISTNDLVVLLEQEAGEVDLWSDLNEPDSENVEGVTTFRQNSRPIVRISRHLSEHDFRENRYRTTLSHELGHVKLHTFLWGFEQIPLAKSAKQVEATCHRDSIILAAQTDWMEWQAGYASGSFLMPATALRDLVRSFRTAQGGILADIVIGTPLGDQLIRATQDRFQVSADAARVRLSKAGYLSNSDAPSLFNT